MPFTDWLNSDIQGLNDNLIEAISGSYPAGYQETFTSGTWTNLDDPTTTTIAAGTRCVTFTTSEDFAGSINGVARNPSTSYTFRANFNDVLPAIACVVTQGSLVYDRQF